MGLRDADGRFDKNDSQPTTVMTTEISSSSKGFIAYLAVTAAYWSFMLTDGALRMLVLLHFHTLGFSPIQLAYLFVLYEVAGMATNLSGGWVAARFGLTSTLFVGLGLQVLALCALTQLDPNWMVNLSVAFVMLVQGASGVAKDLTKMSSKSAVKLLAPKEEGRLFRWVALLTGSKNVVKGCGFLLGAGLLASVGFLWSIVGMASVLGLILVTLLLFMPPELSKGRKKAKFSEVFSKSHNVNWLSAARIFLFGARDVWFVVGIPIYFYAVLSDGTATGNYEAFFLIGTFMSFWIILYGVVQAMVPKLLQADSRSEQELVSATRNWGLILFLILMILAIISFFLQENSFWLTRVLVAGLTIFGAVFAVNSSLHSYLILAFTQSERVTMDVGFYYTANAAGRLLGTLLSGWTYQIGGLVGCLTTATLMVGVSVLAAIRLKSGYQPQPVH